MQLRGGGSSTEADDELAVDAARDDLRLHWWWKWQQIDELAVDAARDGFEAALVVEVAADR